MTVAPLFVDVYPLDRPCDWQAFIASGPPWHGAIFKLSQGLRYEYAAWAAKQRQSFLASDRYGTTLFDGLYHYLDFSVDGAAQAERAWELICRVGGEPRGTLPLMLDAERGGQHVELTKQRVEDVISSAAERYHQLSGRRATLYGGELLRAIGATGRYGCQWSAVALYASHLGAAGESTEHFLARTGTDLEHTLLWQYCAAEGRPTGPAGYPTEAPGCGRVDLNALVLPGGLEAL
ncbi:MAG TPA: GH25 family lysozyme [Kofleriaceae bacterium]|nr:GH25 family lysozyme [Kofleriaceae bacterium]